MIVDPERGVLAVVGDDAAAPAPLLASHAALQFGGAVVCLSTDVRAGVPEAVAEAALLRSELADALRSRHGLAAIATGLHPWSELLAPHKLAPVRPRAATDVAGILGRFDPMCGLRVQVTTPDAEAAVRAVDGLRLHIPLILALAANSAFWRGRYTGLASTRAALGANGARAGLPRAFGSHAAYTAAVDALLRSGTIHGHGSVAWDARLRPELGAVEVTVMDSQARIGEVAGLAALVQCIVRLHAEAQRARDDAIPEVIAENRAAATQRGLRAELIDPGGHFVLRAADELAMLVDACAPTASMLGCSRELAGVNRNANDPGHVRQRSIAAASGLAGLVTELVRDFDDSPMPVVPVDSAHRS